MKVSAVVSSVICHNFFFSDHFPTLNACMCSQRQGSRCCSDMLFVFNRILFFLPEHMWKATSVFVCTTLNTRFSMWSFVYRETVIHLLVRGRMASCRAPNCSSRSGVAIMKRLPRDADIRAKWMESVARPGYVLHDNSYICQVSSHC